MAQSGHRTSAVEIRARYRLRRGCEFGVLLRVWMLCRHSAGYIPHRDCGTTVIFFFHRYRCTDFASRGAVTYAGDWIKIARHDYASLSRISDPLAPSRMRLGYLGLTARCRNCDKRLHLWVSCRVFFWNPTLPYTPVTMDDPQSLSISICLELGWIRSGLAPGLAVNMSEQRSPGTIAQQVKMWRYTKFRGQCSWWAGMVAWSKGNQGNTMRSSLYGTKRVTNSELLMPLNAV